MTDRSVHADPNGANQELLKFILSKLHSGRSGRDQAIADLKLMDRRLVIDALGNLLCAPEQELRADATEALMRIDAKANQEEVLRKLKDSSADVRWHICGLLYQFGDARATPSLINVLTQDPEANVRLLAADALARIGDASALIALQHALHDEGHDWEGRTVKKAAERAINAIKGRYTPEDHTNANERK